jgi:metal-dependent amidase/aminoacylase/carboxypeptidase family protein
MLIMAEVTAEMGAELRTSAMAAGTSVAAEVGRRLERLQRLEAEDSGCEMRVNWDRLQPLVVENDRRADDGMKRLRERFGGR